MADPDTQDTDASPPGDGTARFFEALPVRASLADIVDDRSYTPVPAGWLILAADIDGSTALIAEGRYKQVNMVGAAVIASLMNALGHRSVPVQFGGDGAVAAVAPDAADAARQALASTAGWAMREFGIRLRTALEPVDGLRASGLDVRVERLSASDAIDYTMFAGGGVSHVEARMKAGETAGIAADAQGYPDLTGLSCRWTPLKPRAGLVLSMVVVPEAKANPAEVSQALSDIVAMLEGLPRGGHPVGENGPGFAFPPEGLALEAHASRGRIPLWRRKAGVFFETLIAWLFHRFKLSVGGFDAAHYVRQTGSNADSRKFEDGLKATVDCSPAFRDRLRARLDKAEAAGLIRYGLCEQDTAVLTCFVPSVMSDDHMHFVDGAGGGYTAAAEAMKGRHA